ncbi:alpha-2-macroglobulin family protein [Ferruginibacter sp. HRS2-29]|uniref:alpha-2-macroglobulin family protein n=1 Tax=Ferruginibacter sp. HRS2-29 TaxID=2487334 RepID=UPI0020CBAE7D|nr:alpha-2-macroglobulin family protein [Ferruginibacter sp. HRS2-29]MCP9751857.1 alpha-2-macroglobulin [Ferruginibacter sp. HRS2-29]
MSFKKIASTLLLFLINILYVQAQNNNDYSTEWKKVAELEKKGLTKSALEQVVIIFDKAVSANNEAQQIKSAMYQMKYRNMVEEDNRENNIFYVDTLIAKTKAPAKNILQSMQAQLFWNYKQRNRYRFYQRTAIAETSEQKELATDIATWSLKKLNERITALYEASLKNDALLKANKLNGLDAIITPGKNSRELRPTLYDFLAHRALDYFMSTENDVTNPSYKFILNDEKMFAPAKIFVASNFNSKDTASLYQHAITLLQDILKFHLDDAKPDALIDADLKRLAFVNDHGIFTNKDKLYEESLRQIETQYSSSPWAAEAMYLRAGIYLANGNEYNRLTQPGKQFDIKKAKELCDEIISKYPGSTGALNAQNMLIQIRQPALDISTEKVNVINEPFRNLLSYRNIDKIYIRVIKTSREELKSLEKKEYDQLWAAMPKLKPVKSWELSLPDQKDYQLHATEIKADGLPQGIYIILASITPDFSTSNNLLARQITYVSNISPVSNNQDELYVLDRNTGTPLANAEVQLWKRNYNYTSRTNEEIKMNKYVTDKNGYIKTDKTKPADSYNYFMQVKYKNDELFTDDSYYSYNYSSYETKETKKTFLFTDRSIYRPGQTVFFKGIALRTSADGRKNDILTKLNTTVIFRDVNGQKAGSVKVTTNEYGSYNGSFKLPEGLLNGQFSLYDSATNSQQYFSVEEYKRPKFFTEIKKPEGSYRVNDSITVTGNAKAYAGNNIDGASVKYRVVRRIQYPIWYGWYRPYFPQGTREQMEITNGETVTAADGSFKVTFKAIPDETADKKNQPVFYYDVSADITDINGETRSATTSVAVSYQALQLNINTPDNILADSLKDLRIASTNINGLFEKATVRVVIQKLQAPGRIFRSRYWEKPDQFVMSKEEYVKNFPYDVYNDEDQVSKWPVGATVFEKTDTTTASSAFAMQRGAIAAGWYKITVTTTDKFGEAVKAEKFIQLKAKDGKITDPVFVSVQETSAEPGKEFNYSIKTGFDNIWMVQNILRPAQPAELNYIFLSPAANYAKKIAVAENDRGGLYMNYLFVKNNRVYQGSQYLSVPWNNKELTITYETFRDKLLPGSEEKWKIKIAGNKSDKVAAEALISMYDASLDQFKPHSWQSLSSIWPGIGKSIYWTANSFVQINSQERNTLSYNYKQVPERYYDQLLNDGWSEIYYGGDIRIMSRGMASGAAKATMPSAAPMVARDEMMLEEKEVSKKSVGRTDDKTVSQWADTFANEATPAQTASNNNNVSIRKNFNETAFFFPDLKTDANGNVEFSFTIPEALTTWKLMSLAHTKELAGGFAEKTVITQKPLMVQPNAPRFLREGDEIEFSAKVVNLSDKEITGTAQLELFDAATNKPVDGWFKNVFPNQYFTVAAGQSVSVKFPVGIPISFNSALQYRIKAMSKDGSFSDGEEAALPVLTNRMLVTETLPLNMRNTNSKNFKFEKLLNSANSGSLTNHALTVEYTSNPAWYAVQALPYLMEYPYECAEQNFNRYYSNVLAAYISNSTPKIRAIFEQWKTIDTAALMSNLQKNEELKSALLQETPWVLQAKNESDQKKNIGILFDMVRLAKEKTSTLNKLREMQSSNGGFTWFKGGPDDRYITQYITTGIGHLRKLNALSNDDYNSLKAIVDKALPYLDARLKEDYDNLLKYRTDLSKNNLSSTAIQYLYMRSFFPESKVSANASTAYKYYYGQAQKYWLSNSKYMQAMIALALHRTNDTKTPQAIIRSLKENAIYKDEMGMYFKEFTTGGYYWYQAPVESQAMMIEAFSDIEKNTATVDDLKTWLLKQKQTQNWKTTKATAEACYALLLNGSNWLAEEKEVTINLGNTVIKSTNDKTEAGTGYFKKTIEGSKVQQGMGNITVSVKPVKNPTGSSTSWGAVYWQYFEDLDKITSAETPLKLNKKLFIERNSDKGPVLVALKDGDELKIGDKIKVRIELRADRDMEYIHMKDMRAACMEPVNVISSYKYQGGLGYYESTKDASTNFFFSWLARGTYVFEYPMFVTHAGNFSNGVTTIQSMYAPEFSSHSEGVRVVVNGQ